MKVIDLLSKIANGEDLRFKLINDEEAEDDIFEVENGHLRNSTCGKWLEMKINCDNWKTINSYFLNQEVEIIEETPIISKLYINNELQYNLEEKKIPEKLDDDEYEYNTANEILFMRKINEILDYLHNKGDE